MMFCLDFNSKIEMKKMNWNKKDKNERKIELKIYIICRYGDKKFKEARR